jgi:hypothetical protein
LPCDPPRFVQRIGENLLQTSSGVIGIEVTPRKLFVGTAIGVAAAVAVLIIIVLRTHHWRPRALTIQGAVIRKDEDTRKESPVGDADITASDGVTSTTARSDASGYFTIRFPEAVWPNQTLNLSFSRTGYRPLEMKLPTGLRLASTELYVAAMTPATEPAPVNAKTPLTEVKNIRVRYTVNTQTEDNVGSAVQTFQVVNKAGVPCNGQAPCSPDGRWKAARGSISLDAGPENEFRNVRASCVAGPCPFTRMDSSGFINGGRTITASAIAWSDTATFLLEAEVFRTGLSSRVRELYPVQFGQTLHFTLPHTQEGVSLEADLNGVPMVFPLGPELYLSWADCSVRNNSDADNTTVYRCELKPGYRFGP